MTRALAPDDRVHPPQPALGDAPRDPRRSSQIDRDRILYTSAFRRLAGVTQVVGALEGHVFHNRLTHTIEVAQLSRRLAERLSDEFSRPLAAFGGLDPEVAEAAALAHDLGHPPFGHVAESELKACVLEASADLDGFEGNAQSFRIVTRLTAHRGGYPGLNLTRQVLAAILKYPWLKGDGPVDKADKYGAYRSERTEFRFAREDHQGGEHEQSLPAAIMDHADAVAYSVHDLDDFFRAGLIPLELLHETVAEDIDALIALHDRNPKVVEMIRAHASSITKLVQAIFPRGKRYTGEYSQRAIYRSLTSLLINRFVSAATLDFGSGRPALHVPDERLVEMLFLQSLVRRHVINAPELASQQHGQRRIVRDLFNVYREAVGRRGSPRADQRLVPPAFRMEYGRLDAAASDGELSRDARAARLAADIVASLTDQQAVLIYRRVTGVATGSVMDLLD